MDKKKFKYSPSAIGTYDSCPRKFKLQYLDKVEPDYEVPHLIKGREIHSLFEEYHKTMPPYNYLHITAISEHYKTLPVESYLKYKEHIDNFTEFNKNIYLNLDGNKKIHFKPICLEDKLYDEDLNLVGVIDIAYSDGNGNVLIMDYKTGKPSSEINSQYRLQLAVYKHLWDLFHPEMKATHWGLFFTANPPGDNNPLIEEVKQRSIDAMYKKLEKTKKKIENNEFQETTNKWMCNYCEIYKKCKGVLC